MLTAGRKHSKVINIFGYLYYGRPEEGRVSEDREVFSDFYDYGALVLDCLYAAKIKPITLKQMIEESIKKIPSHKERDLILIKMSLEKLVREDRVREVTIAGVAHYLETGIWKKLYPNVSFSKTPWSAMKNSKQSKNKIKSVKKIYP